MWLYFAIFCFELAWSWVANRTNVNVIKRRPWSAGGYGLISAAMAWAVPLLIITTQDWSYSIPAIAGNALGDFLAARRKGKPTPEGIYGYKGPVNV